jgi:ubiquinone/menaquinone biosynthesis C-methylase UbiE/uncharacterized protein YbaR (Trm112 family)
MEWINILKCPITGEDLRLLTSDEIAMLNKKISDSRVRNADGSFVTKQLEKALINSSGDYMYPIFNNISLLLKDLAITTDPKKIVTQHINADKKLVKDFYDQKGWFTNEEEDYEDAVIFEDLRPFAQDYIKKCHNRVSKYLNTKGKYMLDAASGAIQFDDYLQYSKNFDYHVCVDFSFQALNEAQKKLGAKGIYILADITNLPFKDGVMDGFISINTIYHIPKDEQVNAIKELYRSLAPKGKGIVVYEWFKHSLWMNIGLLPFRGFVYIKNRIKDSFAKLGGKKKAERVLYYYAHSPQYFENKLPPYQLKVWRSLSVHFMRYYIHPWLGGKQILNWIFKKEEQHPEMCGKRGEYPLLVFEK